MKSGQWKKKGNCLKLYQYHHRKKYFAEVLKEQNMVQGAGSKL